jgi:peptide/nickel transport system substrate-binding protein
MKKLGLFLTSLAFTAALAGCGEDSQKTSKTKEVAAPVVAKNNPATKRGMSLNLDSGGKFAGIFNPAVSTISYDQTVNAYVFSTLLTIDEEQNFVVSDITESYNFNKDDNTFTFHLKKGVKFSDDIELTSEDVKFTYSLSARPEYTGNGSFASASIKGFDAVENGKKIYISGIETPDKYTVIFHLEEANARSFNNFLGRILPKHYYEYLDGNTTSAKENEDLYNKNFLSKNEKPIGSGAYKLAEYKAGEYVVLDSFDNFILGAPKVKKIVLKYIPNDSISPAIATGDLDVATLSGKASKQKEIASKNGLVSFQKSKPSGYSYIGFNLAKPFFQDKELRHALALGLNRKLYAEKVLEGDARVINQPLSQDHWAYNDTEEINNYVYEAEKAKEILENDGWKVGKDEFRYKDGKKLTFTLNTSQDQTSTGKVLLALIKENWKEIGVDVDIQLIDFNAMVKDLQSEKPKYDTVMLGWSTIADPDQSNIFVTDGSMNFGKYSNEKVDKLSKKGLAVMDKESRTPIYHEIMKEINEDLPYIFLVEKFGTVGINKRIKGLDYMKDMDVWKAAKTNTIELVN